MISDLVDQCDASGSPLVPVVEWIVDQAVAAQQPIVDGPGVNADANQIRLRADSLAQSDKRVPVQLEDAPVQPVRGTNRVVGKAIHLLNAQLVWPEVAEHHPAACRAKINRSYPPASHCVPFDRLRAHLQRLRAHLRAEFFDGPRTAPVEARSVT